MSRTAALVAVAFATLLQGCVTSNTMYRWGNYDDTLYKHYKNPQDRETFVASMREVVLESEQQGVKTPPGCYAEYGYALYESGSPKEAATYFKKEREMWPESRQLMDKMIVLAERRGAQGAPKALAATQGPAASLQGKNP